MYRRAKLTTLGAFLAAPRALPRLPLALALLRPQAQ